MKQRGKEMLKVEMKIEKRSFEQNGQEIPYLSCTADVHGEKIRFSLKSDDRSLFDYLTRNDDLMPEE